MCIFLVYKIAIWPLKCLDHLGPLRVFCAPYGDWAIPGSEYITWMKIIMDFLLDAWKLALIGIWKIRQGLVHPRDSVQQRREFTVFCSIFVQTKAVFFSGFRVLHSCYWRLQLRRNGLGPWDGWKGFGWWQKELGNSNKNVDVSTVEFLQLGWWISHLSDKLYWPFFSEGTCNFRTITERERCFIDMSIRPLLWLQ